MIRVLVFAIGMVLATTLWALDDFDADGVEETPADTDAGSRGYYLFAGAGLQSFEGWNGGTLGSLVLGRKFNYTPVASPRSSVALELELTQSMDPVTRRRGGERRERDVTTVGGWLALNTYFTERAFHRVRLGAVYRYLDRDPGSGSSQARIGFGLGLGLALTDRVEVVADATLHYMGTQELLYGAVGGLRLHF